MRSKAACAASLQAAAALEDATHTSRAALRPETATVVKMSAGLNCVSVSPLGSTAIPGPASLSPPRRRERKHRALRWLRRYNLTVYEDLSGQG